MFRALRRLAPLLCLALACSLLCAGRIARADGVDDVAALYRAGDAAAALARADAAIAAAPNDARMRFLKGVILSESRRESEAVAVFQSLTQDFPELPEPYNNLAVLQGARGDWHKARESLEAALRSDPGYVTARQNLGDVYLRLALGAYEQARAAGGKGGDAALDRKLALVRELLAVRP